MYVYINSETNLYTVGFYDPNGTFQTDSDWGNRKDAAIRVNFLNGGNGVNRIAVRKRKGLMLTLELTPYEIDIIVEATALYKVMRAEHLQHRINTAQIISKEKQDVEDSITAAIKSLQTKLDAAR